MVLIRLVITCFQLKNIDVPQQAEQAEQAEQPTQEDLEKFKFDVSSFFPNLSILNT